MGSRVLPSILVAEDNASDRIRLQKAFEATGIAVNLRFVGSSLELLGYLHQALPWADIEKPNLILLNFEIGREALGLLKRDPELRRIPVIIMTSPQRNDDIGDAYGRGANGSFSKKGSADGLAETIGVFGDFWLRTCTLPRSKPDDLRD